MVSFTFAYRVYKREKYPLQSSAIWTLFLCYWLVLIQTAFFSRESGSRKQISLILFETWGHSVQAHAYFIENIFMFIPFGILAPVLFKRMKKMYWCVLAGFLMSCTIEISQLLTQRGYMQIDDVLTNTAGAMAGWLIWMNITVRQVLPQLSVFAFLYYRIYSIINISKGMGEAVRCQVYTVHYV